MAGLNHALALIKSEQLKIPYEEALKSVLAENKREEAAAVKAIIKLSSKGDERWKLK